MKYPSITNREIVNQRDAYINDPFFSWEDKKNYTYKNYTQYSYVTVSNIKMDGTKVTADGNIQTFNDSGTPTDCTFTIQMQYQDDWKDYKVTAETYSSPELIIKEPA